jgi:DHA2 family multidrug resistance protein
LYLSAGLALMLAAIQQGERLDWWRSGVFNALFWSGVFFTLCALIRRLCGPNPLVALPYLWKWNSVLLGMLLFWFRFTLTSTIILIPQSLSIRGFEADQIGPAVIWSVVPLLLITFIAALLLLQKLDPRLLLAVGLTCTAVAVCLNAEYTTAWSAANYYRTELLLGVGQSFALIGLVGCIILQGVFTGGLAKPQLILTFSAFFHTMRLFGGTSGAVYMAHFLADREKLHSNLLGLHVTQGSWITDGNLHALTAGLYAKSSGAAAAGARAADLIGARLHLQAYALSLIDGCHLVAWSCLLGLLLTALLRKSPLNYGDLSTLQPVKETHS